MARVRLVADERRTQIVEAAFARITKVGLEGLRTRDVAARVGINIATLHHYFPAKEDLIAAVGHYLEAGFVRGHPRRPATATPAQKLRQEFADVSYFRTERPDWLVVSREFATRAPRDAAAAALVERLTNGWQTSVELLLKEGLAAGAFRKNLDPRAASIFIVRALWAGTVLLPLSDRDFNALCRELERAVI